ncbi:MAG: transcription-repair coupling factor [Anaerolineae bacterium]
MILTGLLDLIRSQERYGDLLRQLEATSEAKPGKGFPALSLGVLESVRTFVVAALQADWPGPVIVLTGQPESARHIADQLRAWGGAPAGVHYFHAPDTVFYDRTPWDRETLRARITTLAALSALRSGSEDDGRGMVVTASVWSVMARSVTPLALRRAIRQVAVGQRLSQRELLEACVAMGYEYASVVEEAGAFTHRGSLVDVYPVNQAQPVRIDFFGDEVDSIRSFDPATQRSMERMDALTLIPAVEALPEWGSAAAGVLQSLDLSGCDAATQQRMAEDIARIANGETFAGIEYYLPYLYPRAATLLDYMPNNALLLVDDSVALESAVANLEAQAEELRASLVAEKQLPGGFAAPYVSWEILQARLAALNVVSLGHGLGEEPPFFGEEAFVAAPRYGGQLQHALVDVAELTEKGQRVVLMTRQAERVADLLHDENVYVTPVEGLERAPQPGSVSIVDGIVAEGWIYGPAQLVVLTDAELFGWTRVRKRVGTRRRRVAPETLLGDLSDGDYVVHIEHGIGRYHGMVRKTLGGLEREYLEIEYASGDRLFVPSYQADRVSRYLGADDREPYMHRLGSAEWAVARTKVEKAVRDIAASLLELYAAREVTSGHAFSADTVWQHELEASFPYEETDDQLRALTEVKGDMERAKPMDRLICGDVGYGKTEVALRAAFKAVMDGKQVAILVPTTVLAQQHFYTFRRRLRAFPMMVEMLSRFRSPEEQDEVLSGLTTGKVDIVVGTHRLLSKDVTFKDLGLLIIDEEQRFGVSHKEQLKQMRREVDVLTLTATPIPRTLYLALSGARDMSVIDTPPEDRLPVRTFVSGYDEGLIRRAILREIDRGGQIYFVHNRVHDIYAVADELRRIVPEASLVVGHGQMAEDELAQVMLGFAQGEHDVLLCTTIIESGLDIPNVNTIIIDHADAFGLAQLHQLRGRVGRSVNRAYAYLLYDDRRPLTDIARKRLQTIQEATELGAGFRVAMRDMEIRGVGEILGAEQHGHIAAIGFDLYCKLLQTAVEELRQNTGDAIDAIHRAQHKIASTALALGPGPNVDLPLSAYLPDEFIADTQLRLRFYRRLARIDSVEEIADLGQELQDRFGSLPDSVRNLLYLLEVRTYATEAGVTSISHEQEHILLALPLPLAPDTAREIISEFHTVRARGTRIWLATTTGRWREVLVELLRFLRQLAVVEQEG